jgi:hypothetical protein
MGGDTLLRYLLIGNLQRETIIPLTGRPKVDFCGGDLLYTAGGLGIWGDCAGLVARVGENFNLSDIGIFKSLGFSTKGISVLPETIDQRAFYAWSDAETYTQDNPVSEFAKRGFEFPHTLLGYHLEQTAPNSRLSHTSLTIRSSDIPLDYFDATAAHIGPVDYISHSLLPSALRNNGVSTVTIQPCEGYMNPIFWDEIPHLFKDITAVIVPEKRLRNLFQGRSADTWEMASALLGWGCEFVVVTRGQKEVYLMDAMHKDKWIIPLYGVQAVDPTGMVDIFCGGFLYGFRTTYNAGIACAYGSAAASLSLEGSRPDFLFTTLPGLANARFEYLKSFIRQI